MKFVDSLKNLKPLEIATLVVFILFIIFPVRLPSGFTGVFDSSIGILFLFILTVILFLYTNPVLGVIFILVAYELIRRGANNTGKPTTQLLSMDNTNQASKDMELKQLNTVHQTTLEEEVIQKMAPASQNFIKLDGSDFKPTLESIKGASLV
jgi:hypothetical protein